MTPSSGDPLAGLSAREREVMDIVHRLGTATAAEVRSAMADPPTDATVRSVLRILEEKGWLDHGRDGARYVYEPVASGAGVRKQALRHVVKTFFEGSPAEAVSALIGSGKRMSKAERERIARLLKELES